MAQQIEDLNRGLENKVRARTAQLEAANQELEAFSYSASHDLRAPLQTIDGFSRALQEDYADTLGAEGKDFLARVRGAAQHMAGLIDDLLKLSRVSRSGLAVSEVDLGALAREVLDELRAREPQRNVTLDIAPGVLAGGDRRLLRVLFDNLCGNAWKFTAGRPAARIEFGAVEREAERAYFVRDNGVGFDMARAGKLFVPFQRLHSASAFPGNGIGLATARRVVQRHGGRIWAESEAGHGTTFYFTLPGGASAGASPAE
jgi:light-regulated signal transduction histidine kinase (bacteriophytochrome)